MPCRLPKLRDVGFAANRRLLEGEHISHNCILAEDTFRGINGPAEAGRQRASGLRFADPRVHGLLHAVILFRQLAQSFRSGDLRQHLAALSNRDPESISQSAIPTAPARAYNRLLRPGLAAALPNLRASDATLEPAFDKIDKQINAWINRANLAA